VTDSSSPLRRFWPYSIIAAILIGAMAPAVLSIFSPEAPNRLGGDFASFYVAGEIVLDGEIERLYEPAFQQDRQAAYYSEEGEFLFFAYPPFVAVAYATIAWLPYPLALSIQLVASLALLVVAVSMIAHSLTLRTNLRRATAVGTALSLLTFPIATAVLGGQNTTLTLMLVLAAFAVTPVLSSPVGGLAAGMLFYKPQFGVLVVLVLMVARKWRSVAWAGATVLGLYLVVVPWLGWLWPQDWMTAVASFGAENQRVNGALMVNAIGWWRAVMPGATWVVALSLAIMTAPTLLLVFRKGITSTSVGAISAWLILASVSALFYDSGLALVVFGMYVLLASRPYRLIPVVIVASWTQPLAVELGWSPLFIVVVVIWFYQIVFLFRSGVVVSQPVGTLASPGGQGPRQ
jgi:hypothetical protein